MNEPEEKTPGASRMVILLAGAIATSVVGFFVDHYMEDLDPLGSKSKREYNAPMNIVEPELQYEVRGERPTNRWDKLSACSTFPTLTNSDLIYKPEKCPEWYRVATLNTRLFFSKGIPPKVLGGYKGDKDIMYAVNDPVKILIRNEKFKPIKNLNGRVSFLKTSKRLVTGFEYLRRPGTVLILRIKRKESESANCTYDKEILWNQWFAHDNSDLFLHLECPLLNKDEFVEFTIEVVQLKKFTFGDSDPWYSEGKIQLKAEGVTINEKFFIRSPHERDAPNYLEKPYKMGDLVIPHKEK
ncbi:MAG: hypothetical protein MRJ96_06925 [Nitrospirales bacterium]|nr:hypothetical protein [Nitrospirales bacterium]